MCDRDHSAEDQERYEAARFNHAKAVRRHAGGRRRHAAAWSGQRRNGHRIRRDREDAGRHGGLLLRPSILPAPRPAY